MNAKEEFARDHPLYHRNVFVMMRFDETPQHKDILAALRDSLKYYGFNAIRADDRSYVGSLWENVRLYMEGCEYGIAVFDQIYERDFNPNVSLELGYMIGQDKKCLVLKEKQILTLRADLSGRLYREFSSYDIENTIREQIRQWMRDLHILPDEDEKLLVFVSTAGIDRCAMAKAILTWLLGEHDRTPRIKAPKIKIESAGKIKPRRPHARELGCQAIEEVCGEDLLASHETQLLSQMLKEEAHLILVMADHLRTGLPKSKTHNFKPFFGLEGDVLDPIVNPIPLQFRKLANELKDILEDENNLHKLIEYLERGDKQ